MAIDGKTGSVSGHGTQRVLIEPLVPVLKSPDIPGEGFGERKPDVPQGGHLGKLMVGVSGSDDLPMFLRLANQYLNHGRKAGNKTQITVPQVQAHVQGDLIVPAPGGVELPSHFQPILFDQPSLHITVHILLGRIQLKTSPFPSLFDLFQAGDQQPCVPPGDNLLPGQHDHMSPAAPEVVGDQPFIGRRNSSYVSARSKGLSQSRRLFFKPLSPKSFHKECLKFEMPKVP